MVDELVQKKNLTKQEFFHLVELHGSLEPIQPNILDIRVTKRTKLREMMMNKIEVTQQSNAWERQ